jgi:hypothetical protein
MAPPPGCRAVRVLVVVVSLIRFFRTAIVLQISSESEVFARSTVSLLPAGMVLLEEAANRLDSVARLLTLDSRSKGVAEEANHRL